MIDLKKILKENRESYLRATCNRLSVDLIDFLHSCESDVTSKEHWIEAYQTYKSHILIPIDSLAREIFDWVCEDKNLNKGS